MKFQPGQSGNPAGRPRGSRNRRKIASERLFDEAAEPLTEALIKLARDGHPLALRLAMDRICPTKDGPGSSQYLSGVLLKATADIKATIVPYRTSPDVLTALLRGDIAAGIESYSALRPAIDSGQVRAIISSGTQRTLANVPTADESGMPKFEVLGWNALFAPVGTPPEVIEFLNKKIVDVVGLPDFHKRVTELGGIPKSSTPGELAQLLASDIAKWRAVIDQAGIERK